MSKSTAVKLISPSLEVLVQAALFAGEKGVKAYAEWQAAVDFDTRLPQSGQASADW